VFPPQGQVVDEAFAQQALPAVGGEYADDVDGEQVERAQREVGIRQHEGAHRRGVGGADHEPDGHGPPEGKAQAGVGQHQQDQDTGLVDARVLAVDVG
jgi:hypothetical protein